MRHRLAGRKLNRTSSHRKALFSNMAHALIKHEPDGGSGVWGRHATRRWVEVFEGCTWKKARLWFRCHTGELEISWRLLSWCWVLFPEKETGSNGSLK